MKTRYAFPLCFAIVFGAADAAAQTLYKLIDKNGKITYSEKPPKDFDGKVVPMNIDPNANTASLPKLKLEDKGADGPAAKADRPAKKGSGDKVKDARDNLAAARKAYQDAADNPGENDVTRVGNMKGGARPVPTESYQARLTGLEAAVKAAEEELKRAEGG